MKAVFLKKLPAVIFSALMFSGQPANAVPLTLNLQDSDLRAAIMMVARAGKINVALDDSVRGNISVSAENLEPSQILDIIAKTANLKLVRDSGVCMITANFKNSSFMQTYVFPVKYGNAEILKQAIIMSLDAETETVPDNITRTRNRDGSYTDKINYFGEDNFSGNGSTRSKNISREDRVFVNPEVNSIVLFGTSSEYERVKKLLENMDVELKQVSVEAKILAIDKNASKNLGVEWMWSTLPQYPERSNNNYTTANTDGSITRFEDSTYTRNADDSTGYGIVRFGRGPENVPFEWYYGAKINALVTDGKAKILSRPNVTTVQGKEAVIKVGSSVPIPRYQTTNSTTTTSMEYRDAGIILKYTPGVNADGTITAKIETEVSTPQYIPDLKAYQFNTRSAVTTVTVKNGEPMIIGGLIGAEDGKSVSKIPFLGDLPILGALFKNYKKNKSESELLIFLTAHVLDNSGKGVRYSPEDK